MTNAECAVSDEVAELMADLEITRDEAIALIDVERQEQIERDARGDCGRCKHYKPDPDAGIPYHGVPHPDAGYCQLHGADGNGPCVMLSGDWCQSFERKDP